MASARAGAPHACALLRYRGDIEAEYKSYSPEIMEILEAFAEGINAFHSRPRTIARTISAATLAPVIVVSQALAT